MLGLRVTARAFPRRLPAVLSARRGYHEEVIDHYENPRNVGE